MSNYWPVENFTPYEKSNGIARLRSRGANHDCHNYTYKIQFYGYYQENNIDYPMTVVIEILRGDELTNGQLTQFAADLAKMVINIDIDIELYHDVFLTISNSNQ